MHFSWPQKLGDQLKRCLRALWHNECIEMYRGLHWAVWMERGVRHTIFFCAFQ